VEKLSQRVVQASIARARAAGALRGVAATATGLATATVVGAGFYQHVPTGTIAGAITVVGLLASPVHDMGRVVEYRQSYRAARRIIEPVLAADSAPGTGRAPAAGRPGRGLVQISGVRVPDGDALPEVDLDAGACIVLDTDDRRATTRVMEVLAGLRLEDGAQVVVNGFDLASTDPQVRRGLIGYAAQGMRIERGPLQRAVRYRIPQTDPAATWAVLREVDLARVVERLPDAELTELRHGGEPLTVADRARLLLARAMLGEPPLLLLDHLDSDLGRAGREFLRDRLAGYPGVVVLASDEPKEIVQASHVWSFP
jgi:ABC-type multidrug transport system fused ATPase/permease subunit